MLKAAPLPIGHVLAQLTVDDPPVAVAHSAAVLLQSHVQHGEIFKSAILLLKRFKIFKFIHFETLTSSLLCELFLDMMNGSECIG